MRLQTNTYQITRLCFQRALAFIYFLGFLIVGQQFIPLLGEEGLLPASRLIQHVNFWQAPSLFFWKHSDIVFLIFGWLGLALSLFALSGFSERFGIWISTLTWFLLWLIYLSFVNVGRTFYGFGWESVLLETGFLAIFLGSRETKAPTIIMWLYRWVLFRVMFGAGLIKLRGDACWTDLTCMNYHYETQPIPNPLSWYFHHLPEWFHKLEVLFTHFVELPLPFFYFLLQPIAMVAGAVTILFQGILILSGNLSWLNYMTIVLCIPCFSDRYFPKFLIPKFSMATTLAWPRRIVLGLLTAMILFLSINPAMNLFSKRQMMNASFDPFHIVNTYGAFGSVGKVRHEVILSGTQDIRPNPNTEWKEYEFKCKPGDVTRQPCIVSPYHLRLDWQIWFAAMSSYRNHPWILRLIQRLLEGDESTLSLLRDPPFPEGSPKWIKADLYRYEFTTPEEKRETGHWWKRTYVRKYLPELSLENLK